MDIWILKYQKSVKIVEEKNVSNVQTKHSPHSKIQNLKFKQLQVRCVRSPFVSKHVFLIKVLVLQILLLLFIK